MRPKVSMVGIPFLIRQKRFYSRVGALKVFKHVMRPGIVDSLDSSNRIRINVKLMEESRSTNKR